jgi:hypothetical protein
MKYNAVRCREERDTKDCCGHRDALHLLLL